MNIIDFIGRKQHLNKMFPEGLIEDVHLSMLSLREDGELFIIINTQQPPAIHVDSYGIWGVDYNAIALELKGTGCNESTIKNWRRSTYSQLLIAERDGKRFLHQDGDGWSIDIEFDSFLYQRCSRYIEG